MLTMINTVSQSAMTTTKRENLLKVAIAAVLLGAVVCDMIVQSVRVGYTGINLETYIIGLVRVPQDSRSGYCSCHGDLPPAWLDPAWIPVWNILLDLASITGMSLLAMLLILALWRWLEKKSSGVKLLPPHRLGPSPSRWLPNRTGNATAQKMKRAWHHQRRMRLAALSTNYEAD